MWLIGCVRFEETLARFHRYDLEFRIFRKIKITPEKKLIFSLLVLTTAVERLAKTFYLRFWLWIKGSDARFREPWNPFHISGFFNPLFILRRVSGPCVRFLPWTRSQWGRTDPVCAFTMFFSPMFLWTDRPMGHPYCFPVKSAIH